MRNLLYISLAAFIVASCQENFDERCKKEAADFTEKYCPQEVEPGNTLDSTTYDIASHTYYYWYSLSGKLDSQEARTIMTGQKETLRQMLLNKLINSVELKSCKDRGIDFVYTYKSKSRGTKVIEIKLTKNDYSPNR